MTDPDPDGWRESLPTLRQTSRIELWVQLREQLADRILDGRIPPDMKLWAQTELAEMLHCSRGTVIRAYDALQEDGLVIFVKGRGLFSPMADEIAAIRKQRKR